MNRNEGQWKQQELSFPVSRGITLTENNPTVRPNLGVHWTAEPYMAALFGGVGRSNLYKDSEKENAKAVKIFHGTVPISAVETNTDTLRQNKVFPFGGSKEEKEVPVKPSSSIDITGETRYRSKNNVWKERKRTFNPPRKGKA